MTTSSTNPYLQLRTSIAAFLVVIIAPGFGGTVAAQSCVTAPINAPAHAQTALGHEPSNMTGIAVLIKENALARSIRKTGDTQTYVTQSLALWGATEFDASVSNQLSLRLIAAENRQQQSSAPLISEVSVTNAFNSICRELYKPETCPAITKDDLHGQRVLLSQIAPDLFRIDEPGCTPVEASLLLFLAIYNNGSSRMEVSGSDSSSRGQISHTIHTQLGAPTMLELLRAQLGKLSRGELQQWLDLSLRELTM